MFAIIRYELLGFLRSRRAIAWVGILQAGLIYFILSIWPDSSSGLPSDYISRTVIYDFLEKLLVLLMAIAPTITVSAFARERQRATLHLLVVSNISPLELVLGKAISSLLFLMILMIASLPALALVLQVGGVPLRSVFLTYGLLMATIVYTGMIGMFVSLGCRTTARALGVTAIVIIALNWVFPSIQLYIGMLTVYFREGGFSKLGYFELFPEPEFLYSTPEWPHLPYYIIDLFSPYSVYCNFRFDQLAQVRSTGSFVGSDSPVPAGGYRMAYEYFALTGLMTCLLIGGCVYRLRRLSTLTARRIPRELQRLQGVDDIAPLRIAAAGALFAMAGRLTIDLFDSHPPTYLTIAAMAAAAAILGDAGARAIVAERDNGALPLLAASPMNSREYLWRACRMPIRRLAFLTAGYLSGLIVSNSFAAQPPGANANLDQMFVALPSGAMVRSAVCVAAAGFFAGGLGLIFSACSRRLATARVGVFVTLFVAWAMGAASNATGGSTMLAVLTSDFQGLPRVIGLAVAAIKDSLLQGVSLLNPFEAVAFPARDAALLFPERASSLQDLPLLLSIVLALVLAQFARMILIKRDSFAP